MFRSWQALRSQINHGLWRGKGEAERLLAITETSEELRERLDLRRQEAGESIESFARDVKLIGHRAYQKTADPAMLEHILIKEFVNGLDNKVSRERVILKAPKTLTEAAQFARFLESAVRVARNHSTSSSTPSTVSNLGFSGRGSSSGPRAFAPRGREQSMTRDINFRGRRRGRSSGHRTFSTESRASSSGLKFGQSQQQSPRAIKCFNCQKVGHYARECRNRSGEGYAQGQGSTGNWRERRPQSRHYSNIKHRVSTVGPASEQEVIEEEGEVAEASGYTANCISAADVNEPGKPSSLHQSRKLLAVPGVINGLHCPGLLVDCGSPSRWSELKCGSRSGSHTTNFKFNKKSFTESHEMA